MLRILLAEDNTALRQLMCIRLLRAGYEVIEAADGQEALDRLAESQVHLLVLDIMMPRLDGCELTSALRNANIDIPILIVTAKDSLDDKKACFLAGADDYLVKPVDMDEMLLHVGALLRRAKLSQEKEITIGSTVLNEDRLSVVCGEKEILLRRKEFQLLFLLLSNTGRIYEQFYQGDRSRRGEGAGLGMAIVRRIVDLHHGEILIRSSLGAGTSITINLPNLS